MLPSKDIRKAAAIIGIIFLFEGVFVALLAYPHPARFLAWMGFLPGPHIAASAGWFLAAIVSIGFVLLSARLPSVRANLFQPSWLKLLSICMAVVSGILEEIAFRSMLMDAARNHGAGALLQILLSSITFGVMHGVWALFRGSWRAGFGAIVATSTLGAALAVVYLASGRSLAPCVTAHFLLNAFAEPGLVLAAVRGEMGRPAAGKEE